MGIAVLLVTLLVRSVLVLPLVVLPVMDLICLEIMSVNPVLFGNPIVWYALTTKIVLAVPLVST